MTDSSRMQDGLSHFGQAFSLMIDSGISIVRALFALEQESRDEGWRQAIHQVRTDVESGASLSEAFSRQPDRFPEWVSVLVNGGEKTGRLQLILQLYAGYLRKEAELGWRGGQQTAAAELALWLRRCGMMLAAGTPVTQTLRLSVDAGVSESLREAALLSAESVIEGESLSQTFKRFPAVFPEIVPTLVEAGETAGDLDRAAFCLADYFELASTGSGTADGPAGFPSAARLQGEAQAPGEEPSAPGAEGPENESDEPAIPGGTGLLTALVEAPLAEGASDLHLQPGPSGLRVRARTGGILRTLTDLQPPESQRLISRLKILAEMNLTEKRSPQEGMIILQIHQRPHWIRVNTFPFADGESVHLQLVENQQEPEGLVGRGMTADQRAECLRLLTRPYGIVVVAGRAGSAVTRTLYTMLHELESEGVLRSASAAAIEDPVEADLPAVMQVQVNRAAGLSASQALRGVLHQDTDIVMISRVADPSLMAEAARAAASGHMVLIGIDAEDAASGLEWLLRLESDVAPDQIRGVVAQRSLRIACPSCRGEGCDSCAGVGYTGSTFAFEVLVADGAEMQRLMHRGASRDEFAAAAERAGMMTLAASAAARVEQGITTIAEAQRGTS